MDTEETKEIFKLYAQVSIFAFKMMKNVCIKT